MGEEKKKEKNVGSIPPFLLIYIIIKINFSSKETYTANKIETENTFN